MISSLRKLLSGESSSRGARVPDESEFPPGTRFVIKEFDVPLVQIPREDRYEWINWFGGKPRPYDVKGLKVGNNWEAESFLEWASIVAASIQH